MKGFCSWHQRECTILKDKHFNRESMDYRLEVDCGGNIHMPVPNTIYKSEKDYILTKIKETKKKLKELEKRLKNVGVIEYARL